MEEYFDWQAYDQWRHERSVAAQEEAEEEAKWGPIMDYDEWSRELARANAEAGTEVQGEPIVPDDE